ncbi:hypothetical protein G6F40_016975 [Rhizopus arrhizus]|nr:hypothetical protein G6F40_016975 [Rhizopus arrhizus]
MELLGQERVQPVRRTEAPLRQRLARARRGPRGQWEIVAGWSVLRLGRLRRARRHRVRRDGRALRLRQEAAQLRRVRARPHHAVRPRARDRGGRKLSQRQVAGQRLQLSGRAGRLPDGVRRKSLHVESGFAAPPGLCA